MGDVNQHERIAGRVVIENHGDEDLEIKNLSAHCGCTVLELDEADRIVPPDQEQEITVFFSTDDRQGMQRKLVTVVTNDPEYPVSELIVKSNVLASFQVLPAQYVALIDVQPGDPLGLLSVFPTVKGTALENLEIEVPGRFLEHGMESIVNDDGDEGIGVSFSVAEEAEFGPIDTQLIFKGTVNGKTQSVWVRAKGAIVGPIEVRPPQIESTQPTPRGRAFAPVTIRPTDGQAFEIASIDAGEYLDHSHATGKKPGDIDISLRLNENAPDGPLAVAVVVRTNHPDMPIVQIPVFVNVLPKCRVQPPTVVFGPRTQEETRRVRLQSDIVSKLEIKSVSCDNQSIGVTVVEPSVTHPKVRFLELQWSKGAVPSTDVNAKLTIETNVAGGETVVVPVEYRGTN
ncbi:MAG: hypothetical protein DHS20C16_13850 [Phycisphaerae bacterium]|nr:MAG: hypothetical protein DHS20C16_13850 [Phycisphaerae bacterium]